LPRCFCYFQSRAIFRWNALLSSVARLFVYGSVAAALPALEKKTHPQAEAFRLPHGMLIAGLALLFTGVLMTRMCLGELIVISITTALAFVTGCGHGSR